MKTASVALATLVLAVTGSTAIAQPTEREPAKSQKFLARLDADKDGKITREESEQARKRLFARLDRNGDGLVDEAEVDRARQAIIDRATMMETRLSMQWQRMDKDGDRKVSADEFQSRTVIFDLADRNGDGVVTADEIDALRTLFGRVGKAG
ncbi:EF-hand domain-containing protein [Mesorhizobium sp. VNQ89]|uniref:EF-hand domain-containing protein n=1 Tax=Mesorhizobium quangtriensis TaxID=3157709 RepID=UPI0032B71A0A